MSQQSYYSSTSTTIVNGSIVNSRNKKIVVTKNGNEQSGKFFSESKNEELEEVIERELNSNEIDQIFSIQDKNPSFNMHFTTPFLSDSIFNHTPPKIINSSNKNKNKIKKIKNKK